MNDRLVIDAMLNGMRETFGDKESFELVVPDLAPTANKLYQQNGSKRFLNPTVAVWRELTDLHIGRLRFTPAGPLAALLVFQGPWLNKDGSIKKSDLDNRVKSTLDALVESRLKFKDEYVWQLHCFKQNTPDKATEIHLFHLL